MKKKVLDKEEVWPNYYGPITGNLFENRLQRCLYFDYVDMILFLVAKHCQAVKLYWNWLEIREVKVIKKVMTT